MVNGTNFGNLKLRNFISTQLYGFTILTTLGATLTHLSLPSTPVLFAIVVFCGVFYLISLARSLREKNFAISASIGKKEIKSFLIALIAPFVAVLFINSTPVSRDFAFRVGPDMFGWAGATSYLASGRSVTDLSRSVAQQLGISETSAEIFTPGNSPYIHSIPSLSDQIAAEFLIGAHRLGIPSLLSSPLQAVGETYLWNVYSALFLWSFFLLALILANLFREVNQRNTPHKLMAISLVFGFAVTSVALEGGLGQLATAPIVLFTLGTLLKNRRIDADFLLLVGITFILALSNYLDALFVFVPSLVFLVALLRPKIEFKRSEINLKLLILQTVLFILSSHAIQHAFRMFTFMMENPQTGGWNWGQIPTPSNVLGFVTWIPWDGRQPLTRGVALYLLEAFVLALIFALLVLRPGKTAFAILVCALILYSYIFFTTYSSGMSSGNSYRLWKLGFYTSLMMALYFVFAVRREPRSTKSIFRENSVIRRITHFSLAAALIGSNIFWVGSWFSTREFTISNTDKSSIQQEVGSNPVLFIGRTDHFGMFGAVDVATQQNVVGGYLDKYRLMNELPGYQGEINFLVTDKSSLSELKQKSLPDLSNFMIIYSGEDINIFQKSS